MAKAAQKAYTLVRDRILSGEYGPSLRLTEQQVADATGVSRTPVREALRRLQSEGLVCVTANQGAVVVDWDDSDAEDVFELRALLEPYGAARAATRIGSDGIEKLRALAEAHCEELHRRKPGYSDRVVALNGQFHRTLHEFADSPRLSTLLPMLIEAPLVMRTLARYDATELKRSAMHHLEIVAALEAHDPEWAAAIMRSHIHAARHSNRRHGRVRRPAGEAGQCDAAEPAGKDG